MDSDVRVRLFGRVALSVNGSTPDPGGARQRAFLSFLASQANKAVSRDEIIQAVWGDSPPQSVTSSIHTYVARIRRALEPERQPRGQSKALEFDGLGYRMNLDTDNVDTHLFESCLERAKTLTSVSPDSVLSAYDRALREWRGSPLVGVPGPFPEMERSRLEELHRSAMEERYSLLVATCRWQEAVQGLTKFARQHPLREQVRGLLITAYYLSGRRSEALMEFQSLREDLIRHLGVEPSPALQERHLTILRGEPLAPPALSHKPPARLSPSKPFQLPRAAPVLLGREQELKALHVHVGNSLSRNESVFLHVDGPPGTGKSALATRFAHEISCFFPDGQLYIDLRGASASGPPLTPDQALEDLLFGLGERTPARLSSERLSGLFRSLTSSKRILILLDNAEAEEQVRALLPGSHQCGVIVTSRPKMTNLAIRDGAQRVTLGPLADEDATLLVLQSVARAVSEQRPFQPPWLPDPSETLELCRSHSRIPLPLHSLAERWSRLSAARSDESVVNSLLSEGHHESFASDQISWSYRSLPTDTALVFRAVGLSDAEVLDARAVSAMLREEVSDTGEHLARLMEQNLLFESGPDRVSMYRYLKLYAREVSQARDTDEDRDRWLLRLGDHYAAAAARAWRVLVAQPDDVEAQGTDDVLPRFETREETCAWLRGTKATLRAVTDGVRVARSRGK